jgi:hypothetical protein
MPSDPQPNPFANRPAGSDFLVFMDESGDHSLTSIDEQYPLFVLTFVIVRKADYANLIVPSFVNFKHEFFGHDSVVLHSHHIRKPRGDFAFLLNSGLRQEFTDKLTAVIAAAPFVVVSTVIRKVEHRKRYPEPRSPYDLALRFCMERAFRFLWDQGQKGRLTYLIAESRGRAEDVDLEIQFGRVCRNEHDWDVPFRLNIPEMPFALRFADKKENAIGLQLADLIAHPIGRHVLKPTQPNRAFDVLRPKLLTRSPGNYAGWGLKIFP